jgi:hypothetical protein
MKGITFQDSLDSIEKALDNALVLNRFLNVGGAGRVEPALGRYVRRYQYSV